MWGMQVTSVGLGDDNKLEKNINVFQFYLGQVSIPNNSIFLHISCEKKQPFLLR